MSSNLLGGSNLSGWAGPLALDDPVSIGELGGVLAAAGFDGDEVRAAIGLDSLQLVRPDDVPLLRRRLAGLGRVGTLASLFVLDTPTPVEEARAAFAPFELERVETLGLVESADGLVRTRVRLVPHDDVLIASDLSSNDQPDHVAGAHNSSVTLANLTVRRAVGSALDVGVGCGIQAILAARHCRHVVGTDINGRALNFAAFNALLNGATNVELRAGSYYEPAAGEKFDLLVANPPYVISPESHYLFRDSGLAGDAVSRELVRGGPALLEEGAFATLLLSWVHPPEVDWSQPLRDLLAGSGCDAVLLYYGTQDPLTHAASWTRDSYDGSPESFDAALESWLDYLSGLGIEGVAYGAVVLRRRTGPNWTVARELPQSAGRRPAGAHLERIFEATDFLTGLDDARLLEERFGLVEEAKVEQRIVLREGEWKIAGISVKLLGGLGFGANIDPLIAHLLAGLDGRRALAEVAAEVASSSGSDPETFAAQAVAVAREMFSLGFLERTAGS